MMLVEMVRLRGHGEGDGMENVVMVVIVTMTTDDSG